MAESLGDGVLTQCFEASNGCLSIRLNSLNIFQGECALRFVKLQIGPDSRATDDFDLFKPYACEIGQIILQALFGIGARNSGGRGHKANLFGMLAECLNHAPQ
ncbi:hypothetical protein D3C78_1646990 [compost metagenome]